MEPWKWRRLAANDAAGEKTHLMRVPGGFVMRSLVKGVGVKGSPSAGMVYIPLRDFGSVPPVFDDKEGK